MSYVSAANIANVDGVATLPGLEGIFENTISALLAVAGILVFIMLVMGGIKFITSGGDPKNIESAKKTLTYALLGVVLTAMGYLILVLISDFTGNRDILNFRINY